MMTDLELIEEIDRLNPVIATNNIARIMVELFEQEYNRRIKND